MLEGGADNEFCPLHRVIPELGGGLQEATWPGRFQPRLYIRIPLGAFRKYRCPGPTSDQLKLNLRVGPGFVYVFISSQVILQYSEDGDPLGESICT